MVIMWQDLHVVDNLGATPFFEGRAFPEFVGAAFGLPMALELYGEQFEESHREDNSYFPGNLDLDPFHLYPAETTGQRRVQFAEIMAGRVSMLAAAGRLTSSLFESLGLDTEQSGNLFSSWLFPSVQTTAETLEEVLV
jgi:Chlorophyll A-B binding protein